MEIGSIHFTTLTEYTTTAMLQRTYPHLAEIDLGGKGGQFAHTYLPNTGSVTVDFIDGEVQSLNYKNSSVCPLGYKTMDYQQFQQ